MPRAIGEPGCAPGPSTVVAADSPGHTEPVTVGAGLQCPQRSNPARWIWPSRRTARHPWNAWPRGCPLPVSQSCRSALAHESPGFSLGEGGSSIAPHSSALCFPADITWYKGHEQLSAGAGLTLSRDGKRLEIRRARLSDAGSYRCVASSVAGVAELWYSLQVTGECSCGCLRDEGFPSGISRVSVGPVGLSQPSGHILEDGSSRPLSSAPFAIPVMQSPVFIPNDVLESHGPMDGYCQVPITGSPTHPVPFAPCVPGDISLSPWGMSVVTPGLLLRQALDTFSHLI